MRLVFRNQFLFSAHVHTKNFRNAYGSVCIQVVLQECDQHTRRSNYGVVQGMCQVFLSVLAVDTDFQTSCLCITKVGAASYLEVFLLTRRPCLNIDRFYFQVSQVASSTLRYAPEYPGNGTGPRYSATEHRTISSTHRDGIPRSFPAFQTDGSGKRLSPRCHGLPFFFTGSREK